MRTTIDIPERLLEEAMKVSQANTKTMAIVLGLQELVNRGKLEQLRTLRGQMALKLDIGKSRGRRHG